MFTGYNLLRFKRRLAFPGVSVKATANEGTGFLMAWIPRMNLETADGGLRAVAAA